MQTYKNQLFGVSFLLTLMAFGCGGGGGGGSAPASTNEAVTSNEPSTQPSTSPQTDIKGSKTNPLDIVPVDLSLLSRVSGGLAAVGMNTAYTFVAKSFLVDVYDNQTGNIVKRVISKKKIADLRIEGDNIYLLTYEWNNGNISTVYHFNLSNLADFSSAFSFQLPFSVYFYKILYAKDKIYLGDDFTRKIFVIDVNADGSFGETAEIEAPLTISKLSFYGDKAILYGRERSSGRDKLVIVNQSDFSVGVRLYSADPSSASPVKEFSVVGDRYLAVGVGSDIKYHDLGSPDYPLVQTSRGISPQCLASNGNFLAVSSTIPDSELFIVDVRDINNVSGVFLDLSGAGGIFDDNFRWSILCDLNPILWQNNKLVLHGRGNSLAFLSTNTPTSLVPTVEKIMPQREWNSKLDIGSNEITYATGNRVEVWSLEDPTTPMRIRNDWIGANTNRSIKRGEVYYVQRLKSIETWQVEGGTLVKKDEKLLATEDAEILTDLKMVGTTTYIASNKRLYLLFNNSGPTLSHTIGIIESNPANGFFIKDHYVGINKDNSSLEIFDTNSFLGEPVAKFDSNPLGNIFDSLNIGLELYLTSGYKKLNISNPLDISVEMRTSLFFKKDDQISELDFFYDGGVVDNENKIVAYLVGKNWDKIGELFFFQIVDNQPKYLGTAAIPAAGSKTNLYLKGDLLFVQNENDGIFILRWPGAGLIK